MKSDLIPVACTLSKDSVSTLAAKPSKIFNSIRKIKIGTITLIITSLVTNSFMPNQVFAVKKEHAFYSQLSQDSLIDFINELTKICKNKTEVVEIPIEKIKNLKAYKDIKNESKINLINESLDENSNESTVTTYIGSVEVEKKLKTIKIEKIYDVIEKIRHDDNVVDFINALTKISENTAQDVDIPIEKIKDLNEYKKIEDKSIINLINKILEANSNESETMVTIKMGPFTVEKKSKTIKAGNIGCVIEKIDSASGEFVYVLKSIANYAQKSMIPLDKIKNLNGYKNIKSPAKKELVDKVLKDNSIKLRLPIIFTSKLPPSTKKELMGEVEVINVKSIYTIINRIKGSDKNTTQELYYQNILNKKNFFRLSGINEYTLDGINGFSLYKNRIDFKYDHPIGGYLFSVNDQPYKIPFASISSILFGNYDKYSVLKCGGHSKETLKMLKYASQKKMLTASSNSFAEKYKKEILVGGNKNGSIRAKKGYNDVNSFKVLDLLNDGSNYTTIFPSEWGMEQILMAAKKCVEAGKWYYSIKNNRTYIAKINDVFVKTIVSPTNNVIFSCHPLITYKNNDIVNILMSNDLIQKNLQHPDLISNKDEFFLLDLDNPRAAIKKDGMFAVSLDLTKIPSVKIEETEFLQNAPEPNDFDCSLEAIPQYSYYNSKYSCKNATHAYYRNLIQWRKNLEQNSDNVKFMNALNKLIESNGNELIDIEKIVELPEYENYKNQNDQELIDQILNDTFNFTQESKIPQDEEKSESDTLVLSSDDEEKSESDTLVLSSDDEEKPESNSLVLSSDDEEKPESNSLVLSSNDEEKPESNSLVLSSNDEEKPKSDKKNSDKNSDITSDKAKFDNDNPKIVSDTETSTYKINAKKVIEEINNRFYDVKRYNQLLNQEHFYSNIEDRILSLQTKEEEINTIKEDEEFKRLDGEDPGFEFYDEDGKRFTIKDKTLIKNYYGVHDPKFSYLAYPGCSQAAVELHEKIYKEKLNESNENFMVNYFKHIMSFNTGFNSLLDEDKNQLNSSLLENCWKSGVTQYVFSDTAQLTSYIFPQNWKLKQIMQAVKEVVKHGGWYYSDLDGGLTFTANINNMCVNVYLNKDNEITNFKLLPWFDILKKFDSQELADKNREFLKSTDGDKGRFLPTSEKTDGLRTIKFSQDKVPNINMMFEENL